MDKFWQLNMDIEWDYPDAHSYSIRCDKCDYRSWEPTNFLAEKNCKEHWETSHSETC